MLMQCGDDDEAHTSRIVWIWPRLKNVTVQDHDLAFP
jgi:hypothetical protein